MSSKFDKDWLVDDSKELLRTKWELMSDVERYNIVMKRFKPLIIRDLPNASYFKACYSDEKACKEAIDNYAKPGTHGDHLILTAIATHFNIGFKVYGNSRRNSLIEVEQGPYGVEPSTINTWLPIAFFHYSKHYTPLCAVPTSTSSSSSSSSTS